MGARPLAPLHERLKKLIEDSDYSQPEIAHRAGVPHNTLRAFLTAPDPSKRSDKQKHRYPRVEQLGAVLRAADVEPAMFPEYRLGVARQALDERVVDIADALSELDKIEAAIQRRLAGPEHPGEKPHRASDQRPPTDLSERRKQAGG